MSQEKVTRLYRRYGPVIYARCLRILRDTASAEDATQETFVRVFKHIEKAPDEDQAIAWIYRIATNYCLNEVRNKKKRPEPREELPERPTCAPSLDSALADQDLVRRLIERAPKQQAEAAWLHYVDGLGQAEVGKILGISRRTVINRLQTFQTNAKKFLGGSHHGDD